MFSQGMYGFLFALNLGGVALNLFNIWSAHQLKESQVGNVICLALCAIGSFWAGTNAFH